jgi:hypothetical protein
MIAILRMKNIKNSACGLIILLLCLIMPSSIFGYSVVKKKVVKHPLTLITDTSTITALKFDAKKMQQFSNNPDFHYNKSNIPGQSLWVLFWRWVWEHLFKRVFNSSESGSFFYYFFVVMGVLFVIFILFKITGINAIRIIRGHSATIVIPYTESLENIHEIDFEREIDDAITRNNYRLAVRLLYLSSLKYLNEARLINWQIEKPNATYISELPEGEKRNAFGVLTRQFEYIWYGNFQIDVDTFKSIRSSFQQFKQV